MKKLQLTIYLNDADMTGDLPLYEQLVRRLRHAEVAGTTVLRGVAGFGKHGRAGGRRIFGVSDDNPIVIVAVDDESRIRAVLPELRALLPKGLITLQEVEIP